MKKIPIRFIDEISFSKNKIRINSLEIELSIQILFGGFFILMFSR